MGGSISIVIVHYIVLKWLIIKKDKYNWVYEDS